MLVPVGEYAARTNLLSALFSAAGAGCFFLVAHESTPGLPSLAAPARRRRRAARDRSAAFTFTNWQNSNETEVYAVATFTIAAMAWLAMLWRRRRAEPRAGRLLLLVVYLAGISIGNHLLALLAGPAIVAFLVGHAAGGARRRSAARRAEWGQVAVVAGVWALLIGTGLGSTALIALGALCFVAAAVYAARGGAGLLRRRQSGHRRGRRHALPVPLPPVRPASRRSTRPRPPRSTRCSPSSAAPSTRPAPRSTILPSPRAPPIPGARSRCSPFQLGDYFVWFDWQWAKSLGGMLGPLPVRTLVTLLFASLGPARLVRAAPQRSRGLVAAVHALAGDRARARALHELPAGLRALVRHLAASRGDHEVRERDYFFVVSFIVWGIWAGIGLGAVARAAAARGGSVARRRARAAPAGAGAARPQLERRLAAAWRRRTPGRPISPTTCSTARRRTASCSPTATTTPSRSGGRRRWPGIRRDVTVVCLALANTDWYMRQLRDTPVAAAGRGGAARGLARADHPAPGRRRSTR